MTGTLNATRTGDVENWRWPTWLGGSYDIETDTLVFGAVTQRGHGCAMQPNQRWFGDNLYARHALVSIHQMAKSVALPNYAPRDWDYDGVNEVVAYKNRAGEMRYATADRNGCFYVLNREDGKFVRGVPFVKDISGIWFGQK